MCMQKLPVLPEKETKEKKETFKNFIEKQNKKVKQKRK